MVAAPELVELPRRTVVVVNVRLVLPSVVTWAASGFEDSPRAGYEARVAQFPALAELVRATMRDTGADMKSKYKETSRGGLAVNVIEC